MRPPPPSYYSRGMETAAALVAFFILAAVVHFTARQRPPKEPAMHPTATPYHAAQRRHGRLARAAASFYRAPLPVRLECTEEEALSFDFGGMEAKAHARVARLDAIAAQDRIEWAAMTDEEIGLLRGHPKSKRRADIAWSKRYSKARRAALGAK